MCVLQEHLSSISPFAVQHNWTHWFGDLALPPGRLSTRKHGLLSDLPIATPNKWIELISKLVDRHILLIPSVNYDHHSFNKGPCCLLLRTKVKQKSMSSQVVICDTHSFIQDPCCLSYMSQTNGHLRLEPPQTNAGGRHVLADKTDEGYRGAGEEGSTAAAGAHGWTTGAPHPPHATAGLA